MKSYIYFDNAATTKLDNEAYDCMKDFLDYDYSNPSQSYSFSKNSKKIIRQARETIAKCINANPNEIFFTSGGSESDNWAIKGVAFANNKKAIITDNIEHHAVLNTCLFLKNLGYDVNYLKVNKKGRIDVKLFQKIVDSNVSLVSIMFANNEIGTIQPIKELCQYAHKKGILFHTDAVQAVGHVKIDVKDLDIDMLSASAHKFNGPKGIGFLYIKNGTNLCPLIHGGAQEFGLRAGTENVASIVGMARALKINCENLEKNMKHIKMLENYLIKELNKAEITHIFNGDFKHHLPGIINISFKNANGEMLLHRLDLKGICVSTGSACDSERNKLSHVIEAIKTPNDYAEGTIRISLSKNNTKEEIDCLIKALKEILS